MKLDQRIRGEVHSRGRRRRAVSGGERRHGVVRVQPIGIEQHPEFGTAERVLLVKGTMPILPHRLGIRCKTAP